MISTPPFATNASRASFSRLYHVKNRCDNDLVTTEIRIDRDHIHSNVTVIEVFVILMNLIDVQKIDIRAARVFEGQ